MSLSLSYRTLNRLLDERSQRLRDLAILNQQLATLIQQPPSSRSNAFLELLLRQQTQLKLVDSSETSVLSLFVRSDQSDNTWLQIKNQFETGFALRQETLQELQAFNRSWTQYVRALPFTTASQPPMDDASATSFLKTKTQLLLAESGPNAAQRFMVQSSFFEKVTTEIESDVSLIKSLSVPAAVTPFVPTQLDSIKQIEVLLNSLLRMHAQWKDAILDTSKTNLKTLMVTTYNKLLPILDSTDVKNLATEPLNLPSLPSLLTEPTSGSLFLRLVEDVKQVQEAETHFAQATKAYYRIAQSIELAHWCSQLVFLAQVLDLSSPSTSSCTWLWKANHLLNFRNSRFISRFLCPSLACAIPMSQVPLRPKNM